MDWEKTFGMTAATTAVLAGASALSILGWIRFRLFVREEVVRVLNGPKPDGFEYDQYFQSPLMRLLGAALDVPSAEELAISTVPIWSTVFPQEAFDDIIAKGRKSKYWPESSRNSIVPKHIDDAIFSILRQMAEKSKREESQRKMLQSR